MNGLRVVRSIEEFEAQQVMRCEVLVKLQSAARLSSNSNRAGFREDLSRVRQKYS